MRYPFVPVAIAYALGIILADLVRLPVIYTSAAAIIAVIATVFCKRAGEYLTCAALFLTGAAHLTFTTTTFAPNDLRHLLGTEAHEVILRGTLAETPYQRITEREELEAWKTIAKVKATAIHLKNTGAWTTAHGTVLVTTREILPPEFFRGQTVEVRGVIGLPRRAVAPGLFDYRNYLRRIGIYYHLFPESTNDWTLVSTSTSLPLSDRFLTWGKRILAHGLPEDENVRLLWAMTLGWKTALTGEVSEPFVRSGTMHIFAVSGLHITLIAVILFSGFRTVRFPGKYSAACVIALVWFYTFATGLQPSGIRSAIMSTVFVIGYVINRPANLLNSLAAAGLLTLLWDPQQLFQAGFQLSFSVVLGIVLFAPLLKKWRQQSLKPDPFLPRELRPKWKPWIREPLYYIGDALIVCVATWLGAAPIIAYYFNVCNPIGIISNLLVVPLSTAALTCNVATLTVGWMVPSAADLLNHAAWFFMGFMVRISEWAADLRWGVYHLPKPTLLTFLAYYAFVVCIITGWLFRELTRKWAGTLVAVSGLAWGGFKFQDVSRTTMTALPLGGGSAIYIRAQGEHMLVDCGDDDNARWLTKPFLQAQGVNRLAHLVLTHGDVRHVGGAPRIHELFPAANIYVSEAPTRSVPYKKAVQHLREKNAPLTVVRNKDGIGAWQVLHPERGKAFPRADDNALVLYGTIGRKRILLLSDLAPYGQNALINRYPHLRADVVITGLPLQGEPVMDGLLDVVQPKVLIVCDSEFSAGQRALEKLKARLSQRQIKVTYTRESAVQLEF